MVGTPIIMQSNQNPFSFKISTLAWDHHPDSVCHWQHGFNHSSMQSHLTWVVRTGGAFVAATANACVFSCVCVCILCVCMCKYAHVTMYRLLTCNFANSMFQLSPPPYHPTKPPDTPVSTKPSSKLLAVLRRSDEKLLAADTLSNTRTQTTQRHQHSPELVQTNHGCARDNVTLKLRWPSLCREKSPWNG